jgi:hypothetical protein
MLIEPGQWKAIAVAAGLLVWAEAIAQGVRPSVGPTVDETRRMVDSGNVYRRLVASSLVWRVSSGDECRSLQFRVRELAKDDPSRFPADVSSLSADQVMNLQQRAEENSLSMLSVFSSLIYESIRRGCLVASERN